MLAALLLMALAVPPADDTSLLDVAAEREAAAASWPMPFTDEGTRLLDPRDEATAPLPGAMDPQLAKATMPSPRLVVAEAVVAGVPRLPAAGLDAIEVSPLRPAEVPESDPPPPLASTELATEPLLDVGTAAFEPLPGARSVATAWEPLPPVRAEAPARLTRPEPLPWQRYRADALSWSRAALASAAVVGVASAGLGLVAVAAANLAWVGLRFNRASIPVLRFSDAAFFADAGFLVGGGLLALAAACLVVGGTAMAGSGLLDALDGEPAPPPANGRPTTATKPTV